MSEKPTTSGPAPAPASSDAETIAALKQELQKQKEETDKVKLALQASRAREAKAAKNPPKDPAPPPTTETKPPETPEAHDHTQGREAETGHLMHSWQRFCTGPNCEGENPNFKDETQCDPTQGGCGMHLGSVEVATSLARCPSCGNKKVRRLQK